MGIQESESDYAKLGAALRTFIKGFEGKKSGLLLHKEVEKILELAAKVGDALQEDVDAFRSEAHRYLRVKDNEEALLKQALRLEQETREI